MLLLDLLIVERCDGIVMLPNWRESGGAIKEMFHASSHGLSIYLWPDRPPSEALPVITPVPEIGE